MATPKRTKYQGPPAFIRLTDAPEQFGMNEDTIKKIGQDCGAFRKVSNMVLINYEIMKNYIDTFEVVNLR